MLSLGASLGYATEDEFNVAAPGESEAPVDVAWLRSTSDQFPLFIFEVESVASGQMAQNAGKVFSQETDLFEKPLFHFHLVLSGSGESSRVKTSQRLFGVFNYRIYMMAEANAIEKALCDVLSQHRRVSDRLDVMELANTLKAGIWGDIDLQGVWRHAEGIGFPAAWLRAYATLARQDSTYIEHFLRILKMELEETRLDPAQYGTYVGLHCAEAIHAALLGSRHPELGNRCLVQLEEWQAGDGVMRSVAPYYGRNEEYDNFVFALMPAIWGLLAALFDHVTGARRWILEQMELVVGRDNVDYAFSALTATWMLHIAAGGSEDCRRFFEVARRRINLEGGIAWGMALEPPVIGGLMEDLDDWLLRLEADSELIPDLDEFRALMRPDPDGDLVDVALDYLLSDSLPISSAPTLAALACQAGGNPS
ncbi:MAG: hypothetical protein JWO14_1659 [Solirubrobacterales bacterium]|nr:hypothetical protein [Solirubrobacterales bacterium]